jgi:threonine/homoserine/homoserine lactone efflux protein
MTDLGGFLLFLGAALVIAMTPGPGILYVAARSLAGGRAEGIASSFGTGLGGFVHILGGAAGVSALLLASAEAFTLLKLAGAAYLVWLGLRTLREARRPLAVAASVPVLGARGAFREGALVEALNPKTAAFFLAFVPQFVDPAAAMPVALQFALLGLVSVTLNTGADVLVALGAGRARTGLAARPLLVRRLREVSGGTMIALGAALAFARRPA